MSREPEGVTIMELARYRLGPGRGEQTTLTAEDLASVGLAILGGCFDCGATIAAYNAYPARDGYWKCDECIRGDGYPTVQAANDGIFADGVPGYRLEPDGTVPAVDGPKYRVCPRCSGEGRIVNPDVDGHGLTREDFEEAGPEFEQDYFGGVYDIACPECQGLRVVTGAREREYAEEEQDRRTMLLESGQWPY